MFGKHFPSCRRSKRKSIFVAAADTLKNPYPFCRKTKDLQKKLMQAEK